MEADLLTGWDAHRVQHGASTLLYTSKATIDTNPGTPFTPLFSGRLIRIRLNVKEAPNTGDLTVDVLFDDVSIFQSGQLPQVFSGQTLGRYNGDFSRDSFQADTKISFQVTNIAGAVGPYVAALEYRPAHK